MAPRDQTHLLEARELVEEHGEHELVGLLRQVGEEQDVIGWVLGERLGRRHLPRHELLWGHGPRGDLARSEAWWRDHARWRHVGRLSWHMVHDAGCLRHRWHARYGLDSPHHGRSCPTLNSLFGSRCLLTLGLPLLSFAISLHIGALHLGNDVRVSLCVLDAHGLVVEREALHGAQGIGGAGDLLEDDEGLAPHLHDPRHQDIQDLAKLGEDGIQGLLELILLDLLIEIVDINSVVGTGLGNWHGGYGGHGVRCSGTAPEPSLPPTTPAELRCTDTQLLDLFGEKQKNPQPKGWDFTSQDISQVMSTDYKSFS